MLGRIVFRSGNWSEAEGQVVEGDHVTDDTGTGFVHTAPGHGREDFEAWIAAARDLEERGINPAIPYTVDENGALTALLTKSTGAISVFPPAP